MSKEHSILELPLSSVKFTCQQLGLKRKLRKCLFCLIDIEVSFIPTSQKASGQLSKLTCY